MVINRRNFLLTGSAFFGGVALGPWQRAEAAVETGAAHPIFAAARREADGSFAAVIFTKDKDLRRVALPGRGHDAVVRPGNSAMAHEVVAFARRPGRFAVAFSHHGTRAPLLFHPPEDRHFFGHGAFSPDGRLLYTSENDFEAGQGVIGIYEADAGYRRVGEFSAYGQGPHDLAVLNDGRTLVVAIGGLETHPDMGRHILNLSQMAPSLVYIDLVSGDLLEKVEFPKSLHQLSIRHLAVGEGERVVFGCQYKGPVGDRPPLMAAHQQGEEIKVMSAPDALLDRLKNYIGSVSVDQRGEVVAASAPRAGLVTYWRVRDGHFLAERRLEDGCGIAATNQPGQFLLTSGHGDVAFEGLHLEGAPVLDPGFQAQAHRQAAFDNHAVFVGLETG